MLLVLRAFTVFKKELKIKSTGQLEVLLNDDDGRESLKLSQLP